MMSTTRALALLALTLAPGAAFAQACGDTLVADTTLTASLTCSGDALAIGADDITLDCSGWTLAGDGTGVGVRVDGHTGVTVTNCMVQRFATGILLTSAPGNHLTRNGVSGSTSLGSGAIQLSSGSDGNVVEGNRAWDNAGRGIAVVDSDGNLVRDNGLVRNAFRGIDLIDAASNAVIENLVHDNTSGGVVISGSADANLLHGNTVTESGSEGFAVFAGTNFLTFNVADDNGTWGIDDTTGALSVYGFNACAGNVSGGSNPGGLCF